MKIENDLTQQTSDIDTIEIREKLNRIKTFVIYDDFSQSYIPDDHGIPEFKAMSKKQNVNAWSSKCNYLIHFITTDFEKCLKLIEEDKYLFVGFRISEKDKEKFYLLENIEYRIFTLCDILAQMYNELFEVEGNIGKINHSFFFKRKRLKELIEIKYSESEDLKKIIIQDVDNISEYFETDVNYKYIAEKRNSFTHRENPHDCVILNGVNKKFLIDHPLYELNQCLNVFVWIYLKICTVQKLFFFMLKSMGLLENYEITAIEEWKD